MSSIDERIVNMKFNNAQFESAIKTTLGSLANLKDKLNFQGARDAIGELDLAGKNFSLQGMRDNIQQVVDKFDGMKVAGITVLATLTSKAVDAGIQMAKNMVQPMMDGLKEYETNMNSIQTILSNTKAAGTTMDQVNAALAELNKYSDQTKYSFSDMAKSIGTFTAGGVNLQTSVGAIKGLANVAAMGGASTEDLSRGMQQLSQGMSAGNIQLEDWNSLVQANLANGSLQRVAAQTAVAMGKLSGSQVKLSGDMQNVTIAGEDFKHSLSTTSAAGAWLTSDVMSNALKVFTGDMTAADLAAMGFKDDQIQGLLEIGQTAKNAATEIKTYSELTGALAEGVGSGWAQSWQIVAGNFEESKAFFTDLYRTLSGISQASSDARNKMLQGWKDLGGRTAAIEAINNVIKIFLGLTEPIKKAWTDVFPPKNSGAFLYFITDLIRNLTKALIPGAAATSVLHGSFKLLFSILKIGMDIIGGIFKVIKFFFEAFTSGGKNVQDAAAPIGEFLNKLADGIAKSDFVVKFFDMVANGAKFLGTVLNGVIGTVASFTGHIIQVVGSMQLWGAIWQWLYDTSGVAMYYISGFFRDLAGGVADGVSAMFTRVRLRLESLAAYGDYLMGIYESVKKFFIQFWEAIKPLRDALTKMFQDIVNNVKQVFTNVSFQGSLDAMNTLLLGGIFLIIKNFRNGVFKIGKKTSEGLLDQVGGVMDSLKTVFGGLTDTLSAMQNNLKASTLMKIAGAIALLTASVLVLSLIDSAKLTQALVALTVMFVNLGGAMVVFEKTVGATGSVKMIALGVALTFVATAVLILAAAVTVLAKLSWGELIKGLVGVTVLLLGISVAARIMSANATDLVKTGIGMMFIAIAINLLASAVKSFGQMDFGAMIQGLFGVGIVLAELALFTKMAEANKGALAQSVGILILAVAVKVLASAVSDFAAMPLGNLVQGMVTLGIVMTMLSGFVNSTSGATKIFAVAAGMVVLGFAMKIFVGVISDLGSMSLETLAKGLISLGVALGFITNAMNALPAGMIAKAVGMVVVGVALNIIAGALQNMGGMSWEEIAKGLITLAVALGVIAIAISLMQGALAGAAAIFIVALALGILTPVIKTLGELPIETLAIGLGALAAVFILLGLAGLVLAPLTPVFMGLGIAIGLLGLAVFGIGVGMLAFATGIGILAAVGAAAIPTLIDLIKQLADTIPYVMTRLAEGIVQFANVIGEAAPVFVTAMVKLLTGLLDAIVQLAPLIANTLWVLIDNLLQLLVRAIPAFVDAGMKIVLGILKGISDNIYQVVTTALDLVTNFLNGIADRIGDVVKAGVNLIVNWLNGIANNMGRVLEAGANVIIAFIRGIGQQAGRIAEEGAQTVIKFVNSLSATIETHSGEMREAGGRLARAILDGMTGGMFSGIGNIASAAWNLGRQAIDSIQKAINSHSPSKETRKLGRYFSWGFHLGITDLTEDVVGAATDVGETAVNTLSKTLAAVGNAVEMQVDTSPTIRPVLDLTNIKKNSGLIDGMLAPSNLSLTVDGSYNKASYISAANTAAKEAAAAQQADFETGTSATGQSITFVQNNNSPKALSAAEIYRQTKNQLSVVKEVVST